MGKARVMGNNAKIYVMDASAQPILVGECDKFGAKSLDELKKSQALGEKNITSQTVFKGYDMDFEGGKVDANLAALMHSQDKQIAAGGRSPYFKVKEEVTLFDGTVEVWWYDEVTLHGYEKDSPSEDQLSGKFSGFCGVPCRRGDEATETASAAADATVTAMLAAMTGVQKRFS
jgi:hypothetical protein